MRINVNYVWIVLKKELKDVFRDRCVFFMNFILFIFIIFFIFFVIIYVFKFVFEVKFEKIKICIIGE